MITKICVGKIRDKSDLFSLLPSSCKAFSLRSYVEKNASHQILRDGKCVCRWGRSDDSSLPEESKAAVCFSKKLLSTVCPASTGSSHIFSLNVMDFWKYDSTWHNVSHAGNGIVEIRFNAARLQYLLTSEWEWGWIGDRRHHAITSCAADFSWTYKILVRDASNSTPTTVPNSNETLRLIKTIVHSWRSRNERLHYPQRTARPYSSFLRSSWTRNFSVLGS